MSHTPFNKPSVVSREMDYLAQAAMSGHLAGDGEFTRRCTALIEQITGGTALLTHSCTAALEMAALLAELGPGNEVIMPSFTFVSTANAVVLRGATPVFVDVEPGTLNIDPASVARAVTARTRAITAVHYAGVVADMDALSDIARRNKLFLLEDAAQAYGATYKDRPAGSLGDAAAFSFHETKNLLSGEGGAIVLNRPELAERARILRQKGTNRARFLAGEVDKYTWVDIGSSFLPGELVAAFLLAQLEQEAEIRRRRLEIWHAYDRALRPLIEQSRIGGAVIPQHCATNGHIYYILLRDRAERDGFIAHMAAADIQTPFHYVPLHDTPAGRKYCRQGTPLPVTEQAGERLVRLPAYFGLANGTAQVIERALDFLRR